MRSPRSTKPRAPVRLCVVGLVLALLGFGGPAGAQPAATTILVIGDSQAQGVAAALQRLYLGDPQFRVLDRSKVGTGLSLRATFDWADAAPALAAAARADVAIIIFGANDRPPAHGDTAWDREHIKAFARNCSDSATAIVKALREAGTEVIWLGNPLVRDPDFNEDMAFLNHILAKTVTGQGARWVPLGEVVAGADGRYAAFGKAIDGETRRLRADDGVHFTAAGYDLIARYLEPVLEAHRSVLSASPAAAR